MFFVCAQRREKYGTMREARVHLRGFEGDHDHKYGPCDALQPVRGAGSSLMNPEVTASRHSDGKVKDPFTFFLPSTAGLRVVLFLRWPVTVSANM